MTRLARQAGRKVHVIADRHPVHRSRAVRAWLAENSERIEPHLMPGYSSEPNPDELLDADIKRHVHASRGRPVDDLAGGPAASRGAAGAGATSSAATSTPATSAARPRS